MSPPLIWALFCAALWIGLALLTWRNSPKFRALYPRFQSGPFWAMLSYSNLFLTQPAISISKALLGDRFGEEATVVYAIPFVLLTALFLLIHAIIPFNRRASVAFDQHLMGKSVTGRLLPEKASR